MMYKSPQKITFDDVLEPMLSSMEIRSNLLGPYNKYNARIFTILMQLSIQPELIERY